MSTNGTDSVVNTEDVIDSRDVIARIEYLESLGDAETSEPGLDFAEAAELAALVSLAAEGADYAPDWEYGQPMVRDSYFTEYARELADDMVMFDAGAAWPLSYIDWPAAARALRMDYSSIDFAGVTYWVR